MVTEAGSYLRLMDLCITQLKAQGPSRTCNESKEEEVMGLGCRVWGAGFTVQDSLVGFQVEGDGLRVEGWWFRVTCLGSGVDWVGV